MQRCLDLAIKGIGCVSPNPMVGSVIVYKNKIIGEGYHKKYGSSHAEVDAISDVEDKFLLSKSTLYVNLEPCSHFGKTPPCSDLIIKYKIPKVIIGCLDTSSKVSGKGLQKMLNAGVDVLVGVLEKESRKLNRNFFSYHEKCRPYVILKWAESKDGFLAPKSQNGIFWMTTNESKALVHKWRADEDAILIGRITAENDNPLLTVREVKGSNPIRIVIDKSLRLSSNLKIFNDDAKTIIFNSIKSESNLTNQLLRIRFEYLVENVLKELYSQKIQSVIIEGGSKTLDSFIETSIWDEARVFIADKKLKDGVNAPVIRGKILSVEEIGSDILKIMVND
jgi:diaminohydroxyphosphoribosylaminopyrimidine deaminase/5-amino-6-(5-phosphoribosylamino)uracil reductase